MEADVALLKWTRVGVPQINHTARGRELTEINDLYVQEH